MSSEIETPCSRIPSLADYCRRVAIVHVNGIVSLGDSVSYDLVRPILESCNADDLRRLEDATPHLRPYTNDLWRVHCFRVHQVETEEYSSGSLAPPKSWRVFFFEHRARKEKRLEELGARLKTHRLEEEERKRQKEIKITDRLPQMKRGRGWSSAPQQKSLFQKTRSEASKIQRTMFEPCMRPPMPTIQAKRQRIWDVSESPSSPKPGSGTRVTVRPVVHRPSPTALPASTAPTKKPSTLDQNTGQQRSHPLEPIPRQKPSSLSAKKEPTCSLFMPKHRAHSQLSSRLVPSRALPTK
ncbi:RNA polymerase II transcription factor SIII subunit A-domain-containing protein [Russula aff. rugulosa BPL654]|nr:RNA polymerase II transcription factor SIII subunit A-domain-containing protein [Russula aff. rugulosa BPL654]